jgi:hypothetical protein
MKQLLQYHTSGTFVQTWKSLHFCLDCGSSTQNFLVSCVSGTVETRHITMSEGYGHRQTYAGQLWWQLNSFTTSGFGLREF